MGNGISVPTGPPGPAGEAPKLFDGSREQWDALTEQERRYVLYSMDGEQTDAFMASQEDLGFLTEVQGYLGEIAAWLEKSGSVMEQHGVESESELPPDVRAALEDEAKQLFGI